MRGSKNGYTAKAFHELCDKKGSTLILIEGINGRKFGGYTEIPWDSEE